MRTPEQIIGHDAHLQLIFEGYDVLPASEVAELRRRLGGGCDANQGGDHTVRSDGKYKFCGDCGESLRGIRYCHEPRVKGGDA